MYIHDCQGVNLWLGRVCECKGGSGIGSGAGGAFEVEGWSVAGWWWWCILWVKRGKRRKGGFDPFFFYFFDLLTRPIF